MMSHEVTVTIRAENDRRVIVHGMRHGARLEMLDAEREEMTDFSGGADTRTTRPLLGVVLLDRRHVRVLRDSLTSVLEDPPGLTVASLEAFLDHLREHYSDRIPADMSPEEQDRAVLTFLDGRTR